MADEPIMPLTRALQILTDAHTRDDNLVGFTVETLPKVFNWGLQDYTEAWRSVRYAIGRKT